MCSKDRTISPGDLRLMLESSREITIFLMSGKTDYDADNVVRAEAEWRDPEQVEAWSTGLPQIKLVAIYCVHGGSVSNI